jgi:hypothetical protein
MPSLGPKKIFRASAEIAFIMLLFYTNLLMGQFTHSHYAERGPGSLPAIYDVVTPMNVLIGLVGAVSGYFVIELFRKYL